MNDWFTGLEEAPLSVGGVRGWTTGVATGSFGLGTAEPVRDVYARWQGLQDALAALGINRLATATQVHGADVATHGDSWRGWLRMQKVDGHITLVPGTAMAVTVADCTPVFIAHPGGAAAVLHAGWRGTAEGILPRGLTEFESLGFDPSQCEVHLGPSICGDCYEVGPEVLEAVLGTPASVKGLLDVRTVLQEQAVKLGVARVTRSESCTRCSQGHPFYSHRGGDEGRQLGIIALLP